MAKQIIKIEVDLTKMSKAIVDDFDRLDEYSMRSEIKDVIATQAFRLYEENKEHYDKQIVQAIKKSIQESSDKIVAQGIKNFEDKRY